MGFVCQKPILYHYNCQNVEIKTPILTIKDRKVRVTQSFVDNKYFRNQRLKIRSSVVRTSCKFLKSLETIKRASEVIEHFAGTLTHIYLFDMSKLHF